jgi:ribosomal protein S12 methylthiotransferase
MPEVDHFLGSSDMLKLKDVLEGGADRMLVGNPAEWTIRATDPRTSRSARHSAYVKIAEGCNRICSFCAIPGIRGKQRSRPLEDVVTEVTRARLPRHGRGEPRQPGHHRLRPRPRRQAHARGALDALADIPGLPWIRLHYLYPESLTKELIEVFKSRTRTCSRTSTCPFSTRATRCSSACAGATAVIATAAWSRSSAQRCRTPSFRTTFIVGHPGETDEDFEELVEFVKWAEFDHVGIFMYSHEEDTHAGTMTDLVPAKVARARHRKLMSTQRPISRKKQKARIGEIVEVLVDGESSESEYLLEGRFWGQAPEVDGKIYLANGTARPGEIRRALVTAAADYDLVADLLAEDGTHDSPVPAPKKKRVALRTIA